MGKSFKQVLNISLDKIATFTEKCVNKRREKKQKKANRKKTIKSELLDWLSAFVFAIVVISLFNMWACQQFVVPTGSMEPTIQGGDRLVVSKRSYGTELYSYGPKTEKKSPKRGDVITFYNPDYQSQGAFVESARDLLFLGTLTLINLNKDKDGNPLEKLFIKRAIGLQGDTIRFIDGDAYIKHYGETKFEKESAMEKNAKLKYVPYRSVKSKDYPLIRAYARFLGYRDLGFEKAMPLFYKDELKKLNSSSLKEFDYYEAEKQRDKAILGVKPYSIEQLTNITTADNGIYVKQNHVLPLGDNRDGSADGRFFGPVSTKKINGRALFNVFPLKHIKKL